MKGDSVSKLLLVSTALMIGCPALAAEPRAAAVPFTWTSCYVGGHVGAAWGRTDISDPTGQNIAPVGDVIRVNDEPGVLGGGQVGCDYQFANNWVVGLAGDFSWTNIDGEANDPFFAGKGGNPIALHSQTDFLQRQPGALAMPGIISWFTAKAELPGNTTSTAQTI